MMRKMVFIVAMCLSMVGCVTQNIEVRTTKQWEGHYMSAKDARMALQDVTLDKKESIWVISNETLYILLKKDEK